MRSRSLEMNPGKEAVFSTLREESSMGTDIAKGKRCRFSQCFACSLLPWGWRQPGEIRISVGDLNFG